MKTLPAFTFLLFFTTIIAAASAEKISKEIIVSEGKNRSYYLFVPKDVKPSAPLIITLHGAGRNGLSLVEKWTGLANKEGIIIAGPDSQQRQWEIPNDGPEFLRELVESLRQKYSINPRRIYIFGHSAGGVMAIDMAMVESQYFAAVAVHAGAWQRPQDYALASYAKRKTPLAIIIGTNDEFFPLKDARATRDGLNALGFAVELTEIPKHTHHYYVLAPKINDQVWDFLKKHELAEEPRYDKYNFKRRS